MKMIPCVEVRDLPVDVTDYCKNGGILLPRGNRNGIVLYISNIDGNAFAKWLKEVRGYKFIGERGHMVEGSYIAIVASGWA